MSLPDEYGSHRGRLVGELAGKHDVAILEGFFGLLDEAAGRVVLSVAVAVERRRVDARKVPRRTPEQIANRRHRLCF